MSEFLGGGRLRCAIAVAIAGALAASPATGAAAPARSDRQAAQQIRQGLVGSWRLVSFTLRGADGRTLAYPYGRKAVGKLTYTADRNMWALVRAQDTGAVLWYTGTFRVDVRRRTIFHHVRLASIAEWEGGDQPRGFRLRRRRLTLSVRPTQPGGATAVLKWRKVSPPVA